MSEMVQTIFHHLEQLGDSTDHFPPFTGSVREAHVHEISLIPALVAHTVVRSTTGDDLLGPGRYSMPCSVLSAILWVPVEMVHY